VKSSIHHLLERATLTLFLLAALACGARAQRPGGPGGLWKITYSYSGSYGIVTDYVVTSVGGVYVATPRTLSYYSDTTNPVRTLPISISGAGGSYQPTPGATPVPLVGAADLKIPLKATVEYVGTSPAPATVRLKLHSETTAYYTGGTGTVIASNGLGHEEIRHKGTVSGTQSGYEHVLVSGDRCREFPLDGGKVVIQITASARVESNGSFLASANLSVTPTDWALSITSDRGETFRRVETSGTVKRISNFFEDDGVTRRANGVFYGDASATEANIWNGNDRDFASTFDLGLLGAWSNLANYDINSSATLYKDNAPPTSRLIGGYEEIPNSPATPIRLLTVNGWANDASTGISESAAYQMRVHLVGEKVRPLATFNTDYLYWAQYDPNFADYKFGDHVPSLLDRRSNSGSLPMDFSVTVTRSMEVTAGFEYSTELGIELPIEVVKAMYGSKYTIKGGITAKIETGTNTGSKIPPNRRIEIWGCPSGSLVKHLSSRYNNQGYSCDAIDYELTNYMVDVKYWERALDAPVEIPHTYSGSGT
jgi:hypothetical protein